MQKMSSLETQKHDCLCAIRNSKSNRYELSFISRSLVPCGFRGFFTVRDWRNPTIFRLLCSWFRSSSVSCTTTRESTNFKILSVTFHSLLINDEWQLRLLPTSNLNEGMELQRPVLHLSLSLFLSFFQPSSNFSWSRRHLGGRSVRFVFPIPSSISVRVASVDLGGNAILQLSPAEKIPPPTCLMTSYVLSHRPF